MELLEMIVFSLQITALCAKKKHNRASERRASSSDESIENLLYYKDCKHKPAMPRAEPLIATEAPKPPACPCPRMCCSMCCDCNAPGYQQSFVGRQMSPLQMPMMNMGQPQQQQQVAPQQPQQPRRPPMSLQPQILQSKKQRANMMKGDLMMQPPIGSRRRFGFTRENIKSLISQDQDIKKILKDLVKVTMTKVDLVERVKGRRNIKDAEKEVKTTTTEPLDADTDYELREEM